MWKSIESAPKDGNLILLDVGLPWAVVGAWSMTEKQWCHASFQASGDETGYDYWFETEWENEKNKKDELNVRYWQELPKVKE